MSATMFTFYINPTLTAAEQLGAKCVGYVENLAARIAHDVNSQMLIDSVTHLANSLPMNFNTKKLGVN